MANSVKKNNAFLGDPSLYIQAGINPKTGLPIKMESSGEDKPLLKTEIKKALRIRDEQNAINRYKWYNLPKGLTGQLIERILYYRGQGMLFYMDNLEKFLFLPYALDGNIDVYGRYKTVTPLPFNGTAGDVKKDYTKKDAWITGLKFNVVYDIMQPEDLTISLVQKSCVLLSDYSKQLSQSNISRQILQDPILDVMAEVFPMARTSMIANSGVKGMRVNDEDQQANVKAASRSITKAALSGDPWIPIVGSLDFQELTNASKMSTEDFLLYMQALDNFRLSMYGIKNGGLSQKKAHMLQSEADMNSGTDSLVYQDGLTLRQTFCDISNSLWDLGMYCEEVGCLENEDRDIQDTNLGPQEQGGSDEDDRMD